MLHHLDRATAGQHIALNSAHSQTLHLEARILPGEATPSAAVPAEAYAYRVALTRFFRRKTRNPQEIDDLIQDVFLRIIARKASDDVENVGAYVFKTAASVLADRFRRDVVRHADEHIEFDGAIHGGWAFDAARILEGREELQATAEAMSRLPERTVAIFILRRLEEWTFKSIATQIGISVSAVEKHMARANHYLLETRGCC